MKAHVQGKPNGREVAEPVFPSPQLSAIAMFHGSNQLLHVRSPKAAIHGLPAHPTCPDATLQSIKALSDGLMGLERTE